MLSNREVNKIVNAWLTEDGVNLRNLVHMTVNYMAGRAGRTTSEAKATASRENGGRPRTKK